MPATQSLNILYIGPELGTAKQRMDALRRLGHQVTVLDSYLAIEPSEGLRKKLVHAWVHHTGSFGLGGVVARYVAAQIKGKQFDLVFVDHGELIGRKAIRALREVAPVIVNYNQDNPYVARDGLKWRPFLSAIRKYDLIVTHRVSSRNAAWDKGVRRAIVVNEAADEAVHRPIELSDFDRGRFESDVAFVGTWMPERGPFMLRLVERGVPLRIYGPRWNKAPEYEILKPYIVLGELKGDDYVKAIAGAKIALGLLSKGNEDLHTTRSFEIPAIGTLFCAENTSDHREMYKDGVEAVFFDSPDECAAKCLSLLADPGRIKQIAEAGRERVNRNGDFNEKLLAKIIYAACNDSILQRNHAPTAEELM